jgi:hypothetical protein
MSELKLNLVDSERILHGIVHGSIADACVAALSAAPETIAELEAALARFIKPCDSIGPFASLCAIDYRPDAGASTQETESIERFSAALDTQRWDAGVVVIDLAARIVAGESFYSQPEPEGQVCYHDGHAATDISIMYLVPDDWLFVNSVDAYQWSRERHLQKRADNPPFDARAVLFGKPLIEFIVAAYRTLPAETWELLQATWQSTPEITEAMAEKLAKEFSAIHARWLMTARDDLRGQAPRDVLLAQQHYIDFDLDSRQWQWTALDQGPPCLSENSFAYRFAGFGTHEFVLYYDLVRHLICSVPEVVNTLGVRWQSPSDAEVNELIAELEQIKTEWLESPQRDLDGRVPAVLIDNERRRMPQAMRPRDMIIDDDCPMCQMFGDETSPLGMGVGFWHLDASHMEEEFAFSSCRTFEEWEAENHRREEFEREFEQECEARRERLARGEAVEEDHDCDPDPRFEFGPFEWEDGPKALSRESIVADSPDEEKGPEH